MHPFHVDGTWFARMHGNASRLGRLAESQPIKETKRKVCMSHTPKSPESKILGTFALRLQPRADSTLSKHPRNLKWGSYLHKLMRAISRRVDTFYCGPQ